jgi:DNA mismatch repair protein MutL
MGLIRQMDEQLATLIAAGEVITGPASVARELIDNALDAGAGSVEITLEDGGLRSIRVADDGCGMDREDALLCLSRHATSKITAAGDLEAIRTLGFRGEALAAVLAVSRLRIETRRPGDAVGTVVVGAGGEVTDVRVTARRPGTTVEVCHLFFNTPARREYQDTARAEAARVLQAAQRAALANPSLRLVLRDGRRELLSLPPAPSLLERARQVHGGEFADALLPVAGVRGEVTVSGFVTHPAAGVRRARRNAFAVNGRPFESFEIRRLLNTAFAPLLTGGSHVEAVLRVDLPPRDVDANVSPDKTQVRFRRPGQVLAAVNDAFRGALGDEAALVRLGGGPPAFAALSARGGASGPGPEATAAGPPPRGAAAVWEAIFGEAPPARPAAPGAGREPRHGIPLQPAGLLQVCDAFLACPVADGLLIVDQHSAHERVHYERLRERFERLGRNPEVQSLIFPEPLELEAERAALLGEMEPFLRRLGFEVTAAGRRQFLVQSAPAALGERPIPAALHALMDAYADARAEGLRSLEVAQRITPLEDRLLKTVACHAAVKAGQKLAEGEVRALWRELAQVDLAGHDVHGRPALLLLPAAEIARRMGRTLGGGVAG